ncbi:unnamed protein product [Linum trigynum]|uniref:Uncharacterized protein n=1 Tax=Linum trigynum TaxID=586398 RepID=A0AAV2FC94_9ROSI
MVEVNYMEIIPTKVTIQYQDQGEGHHQSFPSYEEEVRPDHANQPEYNSQSDSDSFHNYHYGVDEGAFHELDQMEDALPAPVSEGPTTITFQTTIGVSTATWSR